MLKRYIKTALGILLYFLFFSLALVPVLAIRASIENTHYVLAVSIWALGTALFLLPALAIIIRRVWFFNGSGEPVSLDRLGEILRATNDLSSPVAVRTKGSRLIATWKYDEQAWCELLEQARMKKIYELWMRFDNSTKTVVMTDKYRSADWTLSPIKVRTGLFAFSRPFFRVATGDAWGIENYADSSPDDYRFSPNEIKSPLLNTILKNGWNVRFSLF